MTVVDKQVDVRYLNFGVDPEPEPGPNETVTCCAKRAQDIDAAAREMLQGLFEEHLERGLPGPMRFGDLVPLLKTALKGIELKPADDSDRCHWFMVRWTELSN